MRDQIEHTQVFDKKAMRSRAKVQKIQREHGWRED
ncbi:cytosolic protein [Lacticaseibacillus rhamnosus MTCC 5462]|nr:cytosolic protein [Lacticaseibacillus rhamnosus MTCC 5462]